MQDWILHYFLFFVFCIKLIKITKFIDIDPYEFKLLTIDLKKTSFKSKDSKSKKLSKKEKEINKYKKDVLVKIAKKYGINCRKKDGNQRTKEQIFRSLKRKNLI